MQRGPAGLIERIRRFRRDRRGVAAVEFALLLPLMLVIYVGGNELGHALTIARKVTHVTSSLADLTSQPTTLSSSDVTNIFNAAASIMTPYPTSRLRIKLSGITIDSAGVAKVKWSQAYNDTALTTNDVVTLPSGVSTPSSFLVTAEVHYDYDPVIGYVLTRNLDLHDQFYFQPRQSTAITCCS
jgi:Flp pilus assembly protein TadG